MGIARAMDSGVVEYIAQMTRELAELADANSLHALAMLLRMAEYEAIEVQRQQNQRFH